MEMFCDWWIDAYKQCKDTAVYKGGERYFCQKHGDLLDKDLQVGRKNINIEPNFMGVPLKNVMEWIKQEDTK